MAFIEAYIAASQSGKSTLIKRRLADADVRAIPRRLVWDFKREYHGHGLMHAATIPALCDALAKGGIGVYFQPSFDDKARAREFDLFCRAAIAAVYADRCETLMVVEELAFVTTPSWAPGAWRQATSTGMGLGLSIIGSSQMPAQVDKAFFGNCTLIYAGALVEPAHVQTMARALGVDEQRIAQLRPFQFLRWSRAERAVEPVAVKKPRGRTP